MTRIVSVGADLFADAIESQAASLRRSKRATTLASGMMPSSATSEA